MVLKLRVGELLGVRGGGHSTATEGQWQWWLRQHPRLTVPVMGLNKPLPSLVPASALPVDSVGNSVPFQ